MRVRVRVRGVYVCVYACVRLIMCVRVRVRLRPRLRSVFACCVFYYLHPFILCLVVMFMWKPSCR